jgi:hypothetical protein
MSAHGDLDGGTSPKVSIHPERNSSTKLFPISRALVSEEYRTAIMHPIYYGKIKDKIGVAT